MTHIERMEILISNLEKGNTYAYSWIIEELKEILEQMKALDEESAGVLNSILKLI